MDRRLRKTKAIAAAVTWRWRLLPVTDDTDPTDPADGVTTTLPPDATLLPADAAGSWLEGAIPVAPSGAFGPLGDPSACYSSRRPIR